MGAISLPLLALYAFSAKKKGDRIRASEEAKAQAEAVKNRLENQTGNFVQLPNGQITFVPDEGPRNLPEGSTVLSYGKRGDKIDAPKEKDIVDVVRVDRGDGTFDIGPRTQFSYEDLLVAEPFGSYVDGKFEGPPVAAYGTKDKPPFVSTEKNQIYATHPNASEQYTGDPDGFYNWLNQYGIKNNDSNLVVYDQIVKSLEGGGSDITSSTKRDISSNPILRDDVRYTFTDQNGEQKSVMASEGTINPNDLLMSGGLIETGKVGPDNRFTVTSSKTVSPKDSGSDETERKSLLDALDVSDYNIVLRFGPDETQKIGVKTSRSSQDPTLRLRGLLSQMSNNEGALTKVKDNPNALDVLAFKDGVFGLMMEVWNEKDGDLPESIRTYASYYTLEDLVTDQFQSVLLIPGMKEKIDDFDEGLRQKKRADMEEANTTPDQSAGVVTTTVPLPKNIVTDGPNQLEVMYPVIWDSKYDNVVKNNILPYLEATLPRDTERGHSRTDLALMAFERNFIKYETDFSGRILRDKDNNRIPKADQPILDYFNDLYASGEFNDLKRLIDVRTSPSDTLNDFDRDVIIQFVEATDGDLETTTGLISALLPSNKGFKTALGLRYNLQNSNERNKYLEGQIAVRDASRRGLQIVDQAISTYYDSSGNLRGSTVEAEFSLITEGIDYFVGKGAELANIDVNNFNVTNFINNSSNKLAANASGIKGETYKQSAEGRNMLEEEFRKELAKDAQNTDYAQRAFFTLVLAYEVAAAIQGGTGGRTISDQDVALIFRGLRQNWTDSPQAQVSALRAVKGLLSRFELRARMLSSQDVRSGAAYLIAENFFIRAGENIDGMFSLPYIYEELGMEDIPDSENNAGNYYGMTEEDYNSGLLARINNSREAVGKSTFGSLKEAKDDNPTYFGNMQQKYNITLESRGN